MFPPFFTALSFCSCYIEDSGSEGGEPVDVMSGVVSWGNTVHCGEEATDSYLENFMPQMETCHAWGNPGMTRSCATECVVPTPSPTPSPTAAPSTSPTESPTLSPSELPGGTQWPSASPTDSPSSSPTRLDVCSIVQTCPGWGDWEPSPESDEMVRRLEKETEEKEKEKEKAKEEKAEKEDASAGHGRAIQTLEDTVAALKDQLKDEAAARAREVQALKDWCEAARQREVLALEDKIKALEKAFAALRPRGRLRGN